MIGRIRLSVAVLVLALSTLSAAAYAQEFKVEIGFPFVAAGKEMAAGTYMVGVTEAGPVGLAPVGQFANRVMMPVMTYLGRHDTDAEVELVFDKLGDKFHLSEVWLPGKDGRLLLGTKERHDHRILGGQLGKK